MVADNVDSFMHGFSIQVKTKLDMARTVWGVALNRRGYSTSDRIKLTFDTSISIQNEGANADTRQNHINKYHFRNISKEI